MDRAEPGGVLAARYRLRAVIRRDELGVVWLASDGLLHRDVAVRAVSWAQHSGAAEQEPRHERALLEARALARLDHPNIVGVLDIVEDAGRLWLVCQAAPYRFPYRSLRDVVRHDGPLRPEQAARAGLQLLAAIRAAHAEGVLHRDINPGNVLLGQENRVMLAGFGMVTADYSPAPAMAQTPAGPPFYLAPERARGGPATPASDLWSLGAILYAAVEGRPPFVGDGQAAVLSAIMSGHPDLPSRAGPLWPVISGLLRKDAGARPDPVGAEWLLRRMAGRRDAARRTRPAESAGPPVDGDQAAGSHLKIRQASAPPAVTTTAEPQRQRQAEEAGSAGFAAEFIPGFGSRDPAPAGDAAQEHPTLREPGRRRQRRQRWLIAATGGTVTAAAAAAILAATLPASDSGSGHRFAVTGAGAAALGLRAPPGHRKASLVAPDASHARRGPPANPAARRAVRPVPPAPGSGGPGVLPAGFSRYHDPTGFSIGVPEGWQVSRQGHLVYLRDSRGGRFLIVDQSTHPRPNPLADWRRQEAARISSYPGYHRIRLAAVHYAQAERAADWEFTYEYNGQLTRVLNRNILASARHAYALYWSTPASEWRASFHYFRAFAATFRPAAG
jgi:hypothetical protein